MKKIFLIPLVALALFLMLGQSMAFTQSGGSAGSGSGGTPPVGVNFKIDNPFKVGDTLYDLVKAIVNNIILPIGGVLCVLAFIYSGFLYVTARGDSGQIKTAHSALLYASIGTAVLLGAWVIANAIRATVNQIIS
jgi:hypothetical protein